MKTEEIRECLGRCLAITATQDNIYRGIVERSVTEARAELAALEADNARMREALEESGRYVCKTVCESFTAAGGECCGLHKRIIAALTGSPSGAFVTLEQLREIEWSFTRVHEEGADVTSGMCPVCEHESHTSDC